MKRLAVLCHQHDDPQRVAYYMGAIVGRISEHWECQLFKGPPEKPIDADVAWQHCNLTLIPGAYVKALQHVPRVINRDWVNMSKSATAEAVWEVMGTPPLRQGDDHHGPVLVKSDQNAGGKVETALARRGLMAECFKQNRSEYRLLVGINDVGESTWADQWLAVERFQPEVAVWRPVAPGCHPPAAQIVYCLRLYKFMLGAETFERCYSREPIVKGSNVFDRREYDETPHVKAELRALRRRLGADFGKIDFGVVGGRVVVYDCNRTPAMSRGNESGLGRVSLFADALLQEFEGA